MDKTELEKKNILIFTSTFPLGDDDPISARFVLDLACELTKSFNVYVMSPHCKGAKFCERNNSLHIIRYPYFWPLSAQKLSNGRGILSNLRSSPITSIQIPFFFVSQILFLFFIIKYKKINLVNSHWMVPQGLSFALIRHFVKCKHVLTIHAADLFMLKRMRLGKAFAKFILRSTDLCLPVSKYNYNCLKKLIGREIKSKIIPMGVHTSIFCSAKNKMILRKKYHIKAENVLLFVGKFIPKKGTIYLILAFERIIKVKKNTVAILIGSGFLEKELKSKVKELGFEDRVFYPGPQKHEILKEYYQLSDIVVIPSVIDKYGETEGVPVVLLESLASGKPVVATDVGGIPDVLENGYNGLIAKQKDPQDLADKIISLLENNNINVMARNALKSAMKHDWSIVGKLYTNQFKNLI